MGFGGAGVGFFKSNFLPATLNASCSPGSPMPQAAALPLALGSWFAGGSQEGAVQTMLHPATPWGEETGSEAPRQHRAPA